LKTEELRCRLPDGTVDIALHSYSCRTPVLLLLLLLLLLPCQQLTQPLAVVGSASPIKRKRKRSRSTQ
jgi:hypothetical protein